MRSQIALWMLTKIAMLFFIITLALLMATAGNLFKEDLCAGQARLVATRMSGVVNQVLNSPLEDERRVFALEPVLSIGQSDFARYTVRLTDYPSECRRADGRCTGLLVLDVQTEGGECSSGAQIPYRDQTVTLISTAEAPVTFQGGTGIVFTPSQSALEPPGRSNYLIVIKCKQKQFPPENFLFVHNCRHENPAQCIAFSTVGGDSDVNINARCNLP